MGTRYRRTAFQRADTNDVRVSLDVDLVFTDARDCSCRLATIRAARPFGSRARYSRSSWRAPTGTTRGGTPDWIEDVLATGRATEVKKFSKFLHATAALRVDHGGVDAALPHWYGAETAAAAAAADDDDDDDETVTVTRRDANRRSPRAVGGSRVRRRRRRGCEPPRPLAGLSGGAGAPNPVPSPANLKSRDAPRVSAAAARRRYVPVKVEPKTFFANERTMLQWLSMSILILFMSLALLSLDGGGYRGTADPVIGAASSSLGTPVGTPVGTPRAAVASGVCGAILAPVAVAFMAYSLWMYLWRARRICAPRAEREVRRQVGSRRFGGDADGDIVRRRRPRRRLSPVVTARCKNFHPACSLQSHLFKPAWNLLLVTPAPRSAPPALLPRTRSPLPRPCPFASH